MDKFKQRQARQVRAIKNYARAIHKDFEAAFQRWCDTGLAERWAEQN